MRFMIIMKADKKSEAGVMPDEKLLTAMGKYNEALVKAGIMLEGEGLHPTSRGARVKFSRTGKATVLDGPFSESKELVAGYWIWKCKSKDEAVEWVKKLGTFMIEGGVELKADDSEPEVEIRQIFEAEEFGPEFTPELRAQEDRLRAEAQKNKKA